MKVDSMVIVIYLFSNFGHKAMDCRFYGRRRDGIPNDSIRCWTCNKFRHVATTCHTLRCYTCSVFGHKVQECANQISQRRKSPSYTSTRRTSEPWKTNARRFEDRKTNAYSQGHSQAWRHEVDQRSVGSSNSSIRCWTCNHVGHIAAYCCMMRCHSCSGLGHKAQDCWSTQKQPLRSFLYNSSRKTSTYEGINTERTNAKKQVWIKKT